MIARLAIPMTRAKDNTIVPLVEKHETERRPRLSMANRRFLELAASLRAFSGVRKRIRLPIRSGGESRSSPLKKLPTERSLRVQPYASAQALRLDQGSGSKMTAADPTRSAPRMQPIIFRAGQMTGTGESRRTARPAQEKYTRR